MPPALWEILLRALCPHAASRTPSARELSNQLTGFLFDNRLRVTPQEIAAFFARALLDFRSALELQDGEEGEEIRLTSSAEPSAQRLGQAERTPTPTPTSRAPVAPMAPGAPQPRTPSARPAAEASSPLLRLPQFAQVGGAQAIKIDRRTQAVVLALMSGGSLAQDRLPEVASLQATLGCDFLTALRRSGVVPEEEVMQALAEVLRVPYVSVTRLESMPVPEDAVRLVARAHSERLGVVPMAVRGPQLFVATTDANDLRALEELKLISGKSAITPILATTEGLERARARFYDSAGPAAVLRSPVSRPSGPVARAPAPPAGDSPLLRASMDLGDDEPLLGTPLEPAADGDAAAVPQAAMVVTEDAPGTSRVHQRLLTSVFALSGPPLSLAPAFITLAQRLAERLGASKVDLHRVAAAAAALSVASRLEGREPFAVPGQATLRAVLGPAFDDVADLLDPALAAALPADLGAAPAGLAAALRFAAQAGGPTPGFEAARGALGPLRGELPERALSALAEELSDRYVKKPRVLVALKDAALRADVSRLLTTQGFASVSVRSRAELDLQLRSGAATLLAEPTFSGLGTPEAIFELRNDPDPRLTDLPIVLVASKADVRLAHLGIQAGADEIFALPFNEAVVVDKLKKLAQRTAGA